MLYRKERKKRAKKGKNFPSILYFWGCDSPATNILWLVPPVSSRRNLGVATTHYNPGIFSSMSVVVSIWFLSPPSWIPPAIYSSHPHQEHWDQDRSSSGCWWALGWGSVLVGTVLDAPWWNETPASFSFCSSANTCCTLNLCFFPPFWWCSLSKRPDYFSKAPCWGHASIVWPWSLQICAGLRWEGPFAPIKSSRLLQENGSLLKWFTCLSISLW